MGKAASHRSQASDGKKAEMTSKQLTDLMEQNERLLKDRNLLAQKVVDLEQVKKTQVPALNLSDVGTPKGSN